MIPLFPVITAVVVLYIVNFVRYVRKYPKGPMPLPLIGNLLQIKDPSKINLQLVEWSKTYGNVFTVFMPAPWVVLMDYDAYKEATVIRSEDFNGRTDGFPDFILKTTPNGGVLSSEGENWVMQRRTSLHILRDFGMGKNLMEQKVKVALVEFCNHIDSQKDKSSFDLRWPIQLMIGNIINEVLYGWQYKYDDFGVFRQFCEAMERVFKEISKEPLVALARSYPWIERIPYVGYRARGRFIEIYKTCVDIAKLDVENCLSSYNPDNAPECFVHEYNRRILMGNEPLLNKDQLINVAADFFMAGMESTTTTLRWAMTFMAARQDVQERIRTEVHALIGKERMISMSDKQNLPYLVATINEVQRLANVFPINLFHRTERDTKLFGLPIPKDTLVVPQVDAVLRSDPYFDNPEEFRPERFLMDDGSLNKTTLNRLITFGMGKRQCVGESMARTELFICLATILQKYRILPVDGETITTESNWSIINGPAQKYFKIVNV